MESISQENEAISANEIEKIDRAFVTYEDKIDFLYCTQNNKEKIDQFLNDNKLSLLGLLLKNKSDFQKVAGKIKNIENQAIDSNRAEIYDALSELNRLMYDFKEVNEHLSVKLQKDLKGDIYTKIIGYNPTSVNDVPLNDFDCYTKNLNLFNSHSISDIKDLNMTKIRHILAKDYMYLKEMKRLPVKIKEYFFIEMIKQKIIPKVQNDILRYQQTEDKDSFVNMYARTYIATEEGHAQTCENLRTALDKKNLLPLVQHALHKKLFLKPRDIVDEEAAISMLNEAIKETCIKTEEEMAKTAAINNKAPNITNLNNTQEEKKEAKR